MVKERIVNFNMKLPPTKNLKQFLNFIEERQRILLRRQSGQPYPWTKDPILQRFKFCNCNREDDRVTIWIRENWREPYKNHDNLWFAMCVARMINWPDTLEEIGFPETWDPACVLKIMNARKKLGRKVFTSAYLLGGGIPEGLEKTRYTVYHILNPLWKHVQKHGAVRGFKSTEDPRSHKPKLQEAWEWLLQFHGFGKFLAYEVITDLRHTRYLRNAPDIYTWANIGPGAQRGLNRLYNRDLKSNHRQEQLLQELLEVQCWLQEEADLQLFPDIESRMVEHTLCELSKYLRTKEQLATGRIVGQELFARPGIV